MIIYYKGIGTENSEGNEYTPVQFTKMMKNTFIDSIHYEKQLLNILKEENSKKRDDYSKENITNEEYKSSRIILKDGIKKLEKIVKKHEKDNIKMDNYTLQDWIDFSGAEIIK